MTTRSGREQARDAVDASTREVLETVHGAALTKQARDPVALDVREVTTMTDVIYICHAESSRAVDAVADEVLRALREKRLPVDHVEGRDQAQWVLIDLGAVMVHVFLGDRREFYNLEGLWHDAERLALTGT